MLFKGEEFYHEPARTEKAVGFTTDRRVVERERLGGRGIYG